MGVFPPASSCFLRIRYAFAPAPGADAELATTVFGVVYPYMTLNSASNPNGGNALFDIVNLVVCLDFVFGEFVGKVATGQMKPPSGLGLHAIACFKSSQNQPLFEVLQEFTQTDGFRDQGHTTEIPVTLNGGILIANDREVSKSGIGKLASYEFPGNIRELRNLIERAMILSASPEIGPDDVADSSPFRGLGGLGSSSARLHLGVNPQFVDEPPSLMCCVREGDGPGCIENQED